MVSSRSNRLGSPGSGALSGGEGKDGGREASPRPELALDPGCTEPPLVLVPRTKYRHGSARNRCRTHQFVPAAFAAAPAPPTPLAALAPSAVPNLSRPAKTSLRPRKFQKFQKKNKKLVASLLARLEPSLYFRFSLIALGPAPAKMVARLRPTGTSNSPRCFARARLAQ